jgi:hypothetical protein
MAASQRSDPADAVAAEPFDRVARLATMVLGTPLAAVTIAGEFASFAGNSPGAPGVADWQTPAEQALCQRVVDSGEKLVLGGIRLDLRQNGTALAGMPGVLAWAGFPVRDPDGRVADALCVADHLPRNWSSRDVEVLEILAQVAAGEVALKVALRRGAERAALAQTLQESLLPPRLPQIPGLQVAARYAAGGTGAEVLGDFYDVFPSVRGSWGMVVGDVCGKGVPAAKSTALVRCPRTLAGSESCGFGPGAAPALLAFTADAGAFAALGGQHVGVAGVGVTPGQVVLQAPGQHRVVRVV